MKYLLLFLSAFGLYAANPSYTDFNTNDFDIQGTGINQIRVNTNRFPAGGGSGSTGLTNNAPDATLGGINLHVVDSENSSLSNKNGNLNMGAAGSVNFHLNPFNPQVTFEANGNSSAFGAGVMTTTNANGTATVDGGNVTASGTVQSEFGVFTNNDIPSVTYSDSRVVTVLGNLAGNYLTLADGAYGYVDFRNSVSNHVTLGAGARVQIIMEDDASNVVVNLVDSINSTVKISVGSSTNLTIKDDGIGNSLEVYCENVLGLFQTDGEGNSLKYYNNNFSRANVVVDGNMGVVDMWQTAGLLDTHVSGTENHLYSAYLQNSTNYFVMDNANNNINFYTQNQGSNYFEISGPVNASIDGYKQVNGNSTIVVSGHAHLYGLIPTSVTNDYSSDGIINFATFYGNGNGLTNVPFSGLTGTATTNQLPYRAGTTITTTLAVLITNTFTSTIGTTNYTITMTPYGFATVPVFGTVVKGSNSFTAALNSIVGGGRVDFTAIPVN